MSTKKMTFLKEAYKAGQANERETIEKGIATMSVEEFKQYREMCCDKFNVPTYNRHAS